jgi:hypothetical protein
MTLIRVDIEGLRGIQRGSVSGLEPLTVIVGPNNSGKTTFLEAIQLSDQGPQRDRLVESMRRRGWLGETSVQALVPSGHASLAMTESAPDSGARERRLHVTVDRGTLAVRAQNAQRDVQAVVVGREGLTSWAGNPEGPSQVSFLEASTTAAGPSRFVELFSRADLAGRRDWLIALLRPLLPTIKDLRIVVPDGQPMLYVDDGRTRWPLAVAGEGFKRAFAIAAQLVVEDAPLILIEEPENHLHIGAMASIARLFWQATAPAPEGFARQLIVTTHSLDFLDALFLSAHDDELRRSAVVRMALRDGQLSSVSIPGPRVRELRTEIGEDLRR